MQQQIPCDAFRKNPDGSWTCIKPVSIRSSTGQIEIGTGMTFTKGVQFMGINLAELLDESCI